MGRYEELVLPRMVELMCGGSRMARLRRHATAGLSGRVVEVGFGSGLNVEEYPPEVDEVLAVEPNETARRRAGARIEASSADVRFVGLDGASLPIDDASCDAALSTFTLCTIPDVESALRELRRVLKPGGQLHVLEHGRSPEPSVVKWQHRLEPMQRRFAGGCHLTRDPVELMEQAGFRIDSVEHRDVAGPKPWTWFTLAVATNPG